MESKEKIWETQRKNLEKFVAMQDDKNAKIEELTALRKSIEENHIKLEAYARQAA